MTEDKTVQHVKRIVHQFRNSHASFIIDHHHGIGYSIMEKDDIDEAANVLAMAFTQQNEMYKCRGITFDDYVEIASHECRISAEEKLSIVARDTETNQIVGVAAGYSYTKAIQAFDANNTENKHMEAIEPIMDCMLQLYEKVEQMPSFNPHKTVIMDDLACVQGVKYAGKAIGFICGGLIRAVSARHGYSYLLTVAINPVMQRRAHAIGYKLIHSINFDEYTYKGQKVFHELLDQGYYRAQIFIYYLNEESNRLGSSSQAKL
ncbi:hypothetical protein TrispH2_010274 [Trichoplax sp. H2]|nr:hypothetical protein TrispH2_010274 [Trichoplax sp. H2]|eukprot:RDD37331.1 hypothetical protein TrispH2_010274 [Trichoplax sp. H2]